MFASLFGVTQPALAINLGGADVKDAATKAGYSENTNETSFAEILGTVIKVLLSLVGVVFTLLIVYAGDMWLMARGEQEKIDKAKKIIEGAVLGLVVTLAAYTISNFAVNAILERATGTEPVVTPVAE